jgi:hypothetical protein
VGDSEVEDEVSRDMDLSRADLRARPRASLESG